MKGDRPATVAWAHPGSLGDIVEKSQGRDQGGRFASGGGAGGAPGGKKKPFDKPPGPGEKLHQTKGGGYFYAKPDAPDFEERSRQADERKKTSDAQRLANYLKDHPDEKEFKGSLRAHTPITSQAQRGLMGAELGRRREGKQGRMPGMSEGELESHLKEAGGKKLPARKEMTSSANAGALIPQTLGHKRMTNAVTPGESIVVKTNLGTMKVCKRCGAAKDMCRCPDQVQKITLPPGKDIKLLGTEAKQLRKKMITKGQGRDTGGRFSGGGDHGWGQLDREDREAEERDDPRPRAASYQPPARSPAKKRDKYGFAAGTDA